MHLCYIDESGTPDIPGNTSHYVLAGLSIPVEKWKSCDRQIQIIKKRYGIADNELHVAWILRSYSEQLKIAGFEAMAHDQRRYHARAYRNTELLRLQRLGNRSLYQQTKKNCHKTDAYIHLTYRERVQLIDDVAIALAGWKFVRLFAECVDKVHFDPTRISSTIDEQAFEQVVSRFEQYLQVIGAGIAPSIGLLIHDNNETVAKRHTSLMKRFHDHGTTWTKLKCVIETPLFVDSELTSMVQLADLCSYALRRFVENNERGLFDLIFKRADRNKAAVVGVRHFTKQPCHCSICTAHR